MVEDLILIVDRWRANGGSGAMMVNPNTNEGLLFRKAITDEVISRFTGANDKGKILHLSTGMTDVNQTRHITVDTIDRMNIGIGTYHTDLLVLDTVFSSPRSVLRAISRITAKYVLFITAVDENTRFALDVPILNHVTPNVVTMAEGCRLTNDDRVRYDEISEFVSDGMSKFNINDDDLHNIDGVDNMFSLINACAMGKSIGAAYIEPSYYRRKLAELAGWSTTLDLTIPYMAEIHASLNPGAIGETATQIMSMLSKRNKLLKESNDKLNKIVELIHNNAGRNIIIINPNSNTADALQAKLNEELIECGIYHNNIRNYTLYKGGHPVLVAGGAKKGQIKMHGATTVKRDTINRYNNFDLNIVNVGSKIATKTQNGVNFVINRADVIIVNNLNMDLNTVLKNHNFKLSAGKDVKLYIVYTIDTKDVQKLEYFTYKYKLAYNKLRGILKNT